MSRRQRKNSTLPFLALPQYVLRSPQFRMLSPPACKLLMAVGGEFRGDNNGELEMPFGELVRDWHYNSRHTIARAIAELLSVNLLVRTRRGRKYGGKPEPSLYALGWLPIPASARHTVHEITARLTPQVINASAPRALDKSKQVHPEHLAREKTQLLAAEVNGVMRVSQVHCNSEQVHSVHLLSRSMPPSTRIGGAWPEHGSAEHNALVTKYCHFTIPFRARAKIESQAAA